MHQAKSAIVFILIIICQAQDNCGQTNSEHRLAKLQSEVQKHPESAQAHYELATAYLQSNNYLKAIEVLKQAIEIKPDFAEAYCKLGEAIDIRHHYQLKDDHPIEEIEAYSRAIEINPGYAEAYVGLGKTYRRYKNGVTDQEALKKAMNLFNRAVEIKPDYKEAYDAIEGVYLSQHKNKDAVTISKQIVLLDLEDDKSYLGLTEYCTRLRMCDEVVAAYKEIIGVKPDNGKAYAGLGMAYYINRQYDEAADALKQAVKFSPRDQFAHYYLGITYLNLGNKEGAMEEYNILRQLPRASFSGSGPPQWIDEDLLSRINK